ncbi:hypothetical protein [Arenimonas daejeonensis]|uniref:hypothetical protein n=1 Tax=Arenimonas daejeonensis TaxID=370777 RepID=UPI001D14A3BB|nr:hypothetical protein [Arenimonas daejeonensis]
MQALHPAPSPETDPVPPAPPSAPIGRILAIDDDRDLLDNLRFCLESAGYQVAVADNLARGLALAASLPFHVCLLDRAPGWTRAWKRCRVCANSRQGCR